MLALTIALFAWEDLTIFHVNPISYSSAPVNMDTGDVLGDMYFDLRSVSLPVECAVPSPATEHDCDNVEVVADDLVITKVVLTVDGNYGEYGRCNICVNGTDHHGNNSCVDGVYWCQCGDYGSQTHQCNGQVGRAAINASSHHDCKPDSHGNPPPVWQCWNGATAKKTGGLWFSTTSNGYCGDGTAPVPPDCTWGVKEVAKIVNKTCSDNSIYSTVEQHDLSGDCFDACVDSGVGPKRNTSSPCWISCFYTTALGPEAGKVNGTIEGMPIQDLIDAWNKPFLPVEKGGCPALQKPELRAASPAVPWFGYPNFDF